MTDRADTYLPFDIDANDQASMFRAFSFTSFAYIGQALTLAEFAAYVASYDFGSISPDYLILHHTAIPATRSAPYGDPARHWDAGEGGLTRAAVKKKRLTQLANIRNYYRDTLGWNAGPHLFIDDLFIYLFTPMSAIGVHAREGNSYRSDNRLHYSIGVEVIGYYERVPWPPSVERNVASAVALLQRTLKTFDLAYKRFAGGISSHRDYNKPACPGQAITSDYYISAIRAAAAKLLPVAPPPPLVDPSLSLYRVSGKGGARVFAKPHTAATKVRLVKHGVEVAGVIVEGQLYHGVKSWLHLADDSGYIWRGSLAEVA